MKGKPIKRECCNLLLQCSTQLGLTRYREREWYEEHDTELTQRERKRKTDRERGDNVVA